MQWLANKCEKVRLLGVGRSTARHDVARPTAYGLDRQLTNAGTAWIRIAIIADIGDSSTPITMLSLQQYPTGVLDTTHTDRARCANRQDSVAGVTS